MAYENFLDLVLNLSAIRYFGITGEYKHIWSLKDNKELLILLGVKNGTVGIQKCCLLATCVEVFRHRFKYIAGKCIFKCFSTGCILLSEFLEPDTQELCIFICKLYFN